MPENDAALLERFSRQADAAAFTELVRRYAKLVYSTSWRVLKHENDAADVTQETFFELTRQAGRISESLGGWLHRVAVQKSIDAIRRRTHRRLREQTYAQARPVEVRTWQDLSDHVDETMEKLDESVKSLLLDHFLAGKTTGRIAEEQGISQATVSRRINDGLGQLRGMLRRQGLLVGGAALGTMLMENTSQAIPAAVCAGLNKMAMIETAGTAAGLGGKTVIAVNAGAVKAVLAAATIVAVASVAGYVRHSRRSEPPTQSSVPAEIVRQPTSGSGSSRSSGVSRATTTNEPQPEGNVTAAAVSPVAEQTQESVLGPFGPSTGMGGMGGISVGDPFSDVPTADLRTPEAAVYSFLALIDQGATDQLSECLSEDSEITTDSPYPRYLGHPIRLVDVAEDGETARILWEATAHTPFSHKGRKCLPGDFVPLSSRLVRVGGLWKLLKLDE